MDQLQPVTKEPAGMLAVASTREAQSVQAAMVIAQKFPRNTTQALTRIIENCKRRSLAERAIYSYPRGKGNVVSGPSIRLAETIAQSWGNLDFGIVELEKRRSVGTIPGESTMMAYCHDLETNTRTTKIFSVSHKRDTKAGSYALDDERDIYEIAANNGARRLRACILGVIPADVVEAAVEQCEKTMEGGQGPLIDRVRSVVLGFADLGVTQEMIEKRLGHKIEVTTEAELVKLRQIGTSIRDNFADRSEFFDLPEQSGAVVAPKVTEVQTIRQADTKPAPDKTETKAPEPDTSKPVAAANPNDPKERMTLSKEIGVEMQRIGMDWEELSRRVFDYYSKEVGKLTNAEMREVLDGLKKGPNK